MKNLYKEVPSSFYYPMKMEIFGVDFSNTVLTMLVFSFQWLSITYNSNLFLSTHASSPIPFDLIIKSGHSEILQTEHLFPDSSLWSCDFLNGMFHYPILFSYFLLPPILKPKFSQTFDWWISFCHPGPRAIVHIFQGQSQTCWSLFPFGPLGEHITQSNEYWDLNANLI